MVDINSTIYRKVADIMWNDWDPIGVNELFEDKSEYDGYIPSIYAIAESSRDADVVAYEMVKIEKERMGMDGNLQQAKIAAEKIWQLHPGKWEVSVMPENTSALKFWESTIRKFTDNFFEKETKLIDLDKDQPKRIIFNFNSEIGGLGKN